MATMRDSELCALIDREARDAIGVDDYFAADRERAMEFYLGEAKGELSPPAVQGRSKVVSKDLMDTVEWAMPALMRMFASQDDICRFEPETPEDEQSCDDATQYVGYLINRKNNGFITTHDAIKQCLIARMGVTKTYCDKSWVEKEERYQGVSVVEIQALDQDPEVEITEVLLYGEVPQAGKPADLPPDLSVTYDVTCKRKQRVEKFVRIGVPPEEIRIAKDTRTIDDCRFIAHVVPRSRSDLISEGWPKDEVMNLPAYATSEFSTEKQVRHDYDGTWDDGQDEGDVSQEKVEVIEAYTRVDYNKDGVAELRRVVKSGTYVHENEVVDDHPFSVYSPILMPYKVIGLSFYDLVEDLMRIRTALTRQMLDNAYLANNPRTVVHAEQVNLDDLLNPRVGGMVRVKGDVNASLREMVTPFIGPQAQMLLEHFGQVRDTRTGVTEMNSALNAESLAKGSVGSEGVQALMQAGAQRLELIARVIAETGIRRDYLLMLKLVTQYQDRVQQVKINGRWLQIDPREWKNQYDVTVSVGLGNASKQQQVANLTMVLQMQREAAQVGLASPQNIYNALSRLTESMGYKDSDQFWTAPDPNNPPNQGPPPEVQVEQMKQQGQQRLAQIKAQADIEVARMTQEFQAAQAQQETQLEAQRDAVKTQNEMELERYKAEMQMQVEIEKARIQQQTAIQTAQISAQASMVNAANKPRNDGQD